MPTWRDIHINHPEGLRPYQLDCLKFLIWRQGRALIGDAPGVGKTVEALSFLREEPASLPAVIVTTASTKDQWRSEWDVWLPKRKAKTLSGREPKRLDPNKTHIINWDILADWALEIRKMQPRTIIADECHKAANLSAMRTRALQYVQNGTDFFLPMSGTPIQSRPGQFYPVLHMLEPARYPTLKKFQAKYCNMRMNPWSGYLEEARGGKNLAALNRDLAGIMIRREKRDVLPDLPPLTRSIVRIRLIDPARYLAQQQETFGRMAGDHFAALARLDELGMSAFVQKREGVVSWISDFLESGEKLVVFAYHKAALAAIQEGVGGDSVRIDGGVTGTRREAAKRKFMEDPDCRLMVAQIDAMGEGVDGLQRVCSNCAFAEFGRTALSHDQAWSRFERSGQLHGINAYFLVGEDTIDEDRMSVLDAQMKTFNSAVRGHSDDGDLLMALYKKIKGER